MNPDPHAFARLVPGFEFLQALGQKGAAGLPGGGFGSWIAPTLDPAELDKRIGELKTVQYWLEQNTRVLATTIQALEVQRMTLATLKSMNVPLAGTPPATAGAATRKGKGHAQGEGKGEVAVDPMAWWGALTQQFGELASKVMTDAAAAVPAAAGTAEPRPAPRRKAAAKRR